MPERAEREANRSVAGEAQPGDKQVDHALRPRSLQEMIGQERLRDKMQILVDAARQRGDALDHVLLYGPPGLGKTTLSHILAHEMGANLKVTAGPAVEKAGDLAAILTNLRKGDILFIDEIHRLGRAVEEILYPAMEDFSLNIVVGSGPGARNIQLSLPKFTVVGATTRLALMTSPLRARFGVVERFDFYDQPRRAGDRDARRAAAQGAHRPGRVAGHCPPCPRHPTRVAAPAAPPARLRPGARRRPHHRAGGGRGAVAAGDRRTGAGRPGPPRCSTR